MCRTDAAVGPLGVVVVLRHAGVAEEAVARPHRLLCLQTKSTCVTAVAIRTDGTRSYECEAHHARRAEYSGVQTAGLGQHQHILTTQTNRRSFMHATLSGETSVRA